MNSRFYLTCVFSISFLFATAQNETGYIRNGNKLYKNKKFNEALEEYKKAGAVNANNPVVNYNLGNALFRTNNLEEAVKAFENTISNTNNSRLREKAFYNMGVSFSKSNKLEESIVAYKTALKLDPKDEDARFNLQKALSELPKKQPEKKQQKQQKQQQNPKPSKSKLSKKEVEQFLKALEEKEKQVQEKMQQSKTPATSQPEKDW